MTHFRRFSSILFALALGLGVGLTVPSAGPAEDAPTGNTRPANTGGTRRSSRLDDKKKAEEAGTKKEAEKPKKNEEKAPEKKAEKPNAAERKKSENTVPAAPAPVGGPALGEFTVTVDAASRMLRLHPKDHADRQDMQVIIGEEFVTEISYDNQSLDPFDEIRVLLSYEADLLEPLAINDAVLAGRLKDEAVAQVDPLIGTILYEARLADPLSVNDAPIMSIRWRSKKLTRGTTIEFSSREDAYTAVVGAGRDLLGNPRQPGDGTLNMSVVVLPENPREADAFLNDPRLFETSNSKIGGVRLYMMGPEEPIVAGEPFAVDLILDNRAYSNLDNLEILITYDSEALEVLDADADNFITRETNLHDGPFHEMFPWNFHIDNIAYPRRGIISYRVGTDNPDDFRGKVGAFARIYAVARGASEGTPLVFRFSRKARINGTAVTFNGADCLGDPETFGDGTQGLLIRALAAPASNVATGN